MTLRTDPVGYVAILALVTALKEVSIRTAWKGQGWHTVLVPSSPHLPLRSNWRLLIPVKFVYGAKHGKRYDKVIGILGHLGEV